MTRLVLKPDDLLEMGVVASEGLPGSSSASPEVVSAEAPVRERVAAEKAYGRVRLNPRGFGFITIPAADCYVAAPLAKSLVDGDLVEFTLSTASDKHASRSARKILSVSRRPTRVLGALRKSGEVWTLVSDDVCFHDLIIKDIPAGTNLTEGHVASVRIPAYEGPPTQGAIEVSLEELLGPRNREEFHLDYAQLKYGFDEAFPQAVLDEAQAMQSLDPGSAMDFTAIPFVTIDGDSTKDFDDAIFAQNLPGGGWLVRVAITDVSSYVKAGTALDSWASERCTSVYLPGRVLPMLPAALSYTTCSLLPGQVRRAVVLTMQLDARGQVVSRLINRGLIKSAARLTYNEVSVYHETGVPLPEWHPVIRANLDAMQSAATVLRQERVARGMFDFDEPEPVFVRGPGGSWYLNWEARNDSHKLVEEFMLLANKVAAELLKARYGLALVRHQPAPAQSDWEELCQWAAHQGLALPESPSMRAMADLLGSIEDQDKKAGLSLKIRSCMQPARYTVAQASDDAGHFSLGFELYTHFSSPLRRYADLLVHRLLLAPAGAEDSTEFVQDLVERVERCSDRASAAKFAERSIWDFLKLQNFLSRVKQEDSIQARVVRATARGLRVVAHGWQCSAWLSSDNLRKNGYQFASSAGRWEAAGLPAIAEGTTVLVRRTDLVLDRPAYPELQVVLNCTPAEEGLEPVGPPVS